MITFETVDIDGFTFDVFQNVEHADEYLLADINAAAWRAADDPTKKRGLVMSTRILMRQRWHDGVLTDPIPQAILDASIELASAIVGGYDAANLATTATGIKRQKAGSVEQEFFAPGLAGTDAGHRFPLPVWELIKGLIGGGDASDIGGSYSRGICGGSITEIDNSAAYAGVGSYYHRDCE